MTLLLGAGACGGDSVAPPAPISVTFQNHLYVPVRLTVGSQDFGTVTDTKTVVFPGGTTSITWTPENFHYSDGSEELDDFGAQSMLVADLATLEFRAESNSAIYVTPYITNDTGAPIVVGVLNGGAVHCLGTQGTGSGVQWGYYRLGSDTDIRYYRSGSQCTGPSRSWSSATLIGARNGTNGLALLDADIPP